MIKITEDNYFSFVERYKNCHPLLILRTLEKTKQDISTKIDNVEKMLSDEIDELSKDLSKAEEQTVDLFKYKWLAFGGGTVVLWVFSNIEAIKKLFAIK